MNAAKYPRFRKVLIIPAALVGVVALVIAIKSKQPPERILPAEKITPVRIIEAPRLTVTPRVLAYGNVRPGTVWNAVAEVNGKILEIHPQLKKGAILPKGAVLYRIDPAPFELAAARIKADIRAAKAHLVELKIKEENTQAALEIEKRSLELSSHSLDRQRRLFKEGAASQAAVDKEERNVLARRLSVQMRRNTLNLIPAERETLEAQLAANRSRLESARLDLKNTAIRAPFDLLVADVRAEKGQFATRSQTLAVVDSIDVAEISAQLPIDRMMSIAWPGGADSMELAEMTQLMRKLPAIFEADSVVRLRAGKRVIKWPARVIRISDAIDPQTRTAGVIVAVDDPYRQAHPGRKPPLVKNMYVEVELRGRPRDGLVAIPREALHGSEVYVVGAENRLEKRAVKVSFRQANFVALASGLDAGERVIVTDLIFAIEGMLLAPVKDAKALEALKAEATGAGAVR